MQKEEGPHSSVPPKGTESYSQVVFALSLSFWIFKLIIYNQNKIRYNQVKHYLNKILKCYVLF